MLGKVFTIAALAVILGLPAAPVAQADPPYRNCHEAHADYRYNIPSHDPAYHPALDPDGDGWACEAHLGEVR